MIEKEHNQDQEFSFLHSELVVNTSELERYFQSLRYRDDKLLEGAELDAVRSVLDDLKDAMDPDPEIMHDIVWKHVIKGSLTDQFELAGRRAFLANPYIKELKTLSEDYNSTYNQFMGHLLIYLYASALKNASMYAGEPEQRIAFCEILRQISFSEHMLENENFYHAFYASYPRHADDAFEPLDNKMFNQLFNDVVSAASESENEAGNTKGSSISSQSSGPSHLRIIKS
jgi:hypothetical protein